MSGMIFDALTGKVTIDNSTPLPPTFESQLAAAKLSRSAAYRNEADPLFFKVQRGEATEQEWLDKIEEIRNRFPYP
jgi:hypothetical protein